MEQLINDLKKEIIEALSLEDITPEDNTLFWILLATDLSSPNEKSSELLLIRLLHAVKTNNVIDNKPNKNFFIQKTQNLLRGFKRKKADV